MNTMTFLEYVADFLELHRGYGASCYCPYCDPHCESAWMSFSIRPPRQRPDGSWLPIKFRCHRCQQWGDARDLIKHFWNGIPGKHLSPEETEARFVEVLERYRDKYFPGTPLGEIRRSIDLPPELISIIAQRGKRDRELAEKLSAKIHEGIANDRRQAERKVS